jgi:DNA-directed RNA polymerase I subunit RPA34.5
MITMSKSQKKRSQVTFSNETNQESNDDDDDDDDDDDAAATTVVASNRDEIINQHHGIVDDGTTVPLDAPTFQLPLDTDRYELWTVRLPSSVNVQDLNHSTLQLPALDTECTGTTTTERPNSRHTFQSNDGSTYTFQWGLAVENESFRLLAPAPSSTKAMVVSPSTFQKHLNVVLVPTVTTLQTIAAIGHVEQQQPRSTAAVEMESMHQRHAYAPIPQKTGLKRRWLPMGALATATAVADLPNPMPPDAPDTPDRNIHVESPAKRIKAEVQVNGYATSTKEMHNIKQEDETQEDMDNRATTITDATRNDQRSHSKKAMKAEKKAAKKERKQKKNKQER